MLARMSPTLGALHGFESAVFDAAYWLRELNTCAMLHIHFCCGRSHRVVRAEKALSAAVVAFLIARRRE